MFFLLNLWTPESRHDAGKNRMLKKVVSYDNCQRVSQEESRVSISHLFYIPDKKPYAEFSLNYPPGKKP